MAWIQFKLGRPNAEYTFDINPAGMDIGSGPLVVRQRNLTGDLKKSIIKIEVPTIKINSNYLLFADRNKFVTLINTADTFLSFQTRDDWQMPVERNIPLTVSTVKIQNSSITKLDEALIAAGGSGQVTITGVYLSSAGTGTNYYTGGSYNGSTRTITLGTPLSSVVPVFVTYTYKGWLVDIETFSPTAKGGWLDRFQYNEFQLIGA